MLCEEDGRRDSDTEQSYYSDDVLPFPVIQSFGKNIL
jgi:hypothetical protein